MMRIKSLAIFFVSFVITVHAHLPSALAETFDRLQTPFQDALQTGNWGLALGLVFVAGLATSLTPCVYPMIVITVSIFGALQTKTRLQGAMLSTAFVLGMAVFFTPLGLFAALTGEVFGSFLASPWIIVALSLLFLFLAASMFGLFDMDLPLALRNKLHAMGGVGIRGAFVLGLISALVAAPCTGPVIGFLLTWVGTTGNVTFGAFSFFTYALGLGLIFWIVGTFSVSLPKSGAWLLWIKSFFGILMVVVAMYYLKNLFPDLFHPAERTTGILMLGGAAILVGVALGAIHLSYNNSPINHRIRKSLGIALTVAGFISLIIYFETPPSGMKIEWREDYQKAKTFARETHKPFVVDFTASWCAACGELDRKTFSDPDVVREMARFVAVRIDLSPTKDTEEKQKILESYNHPGLPLVVLHMKTGEEASRIAEYIDASRFLKLLRKVD